MSFLEQVLAGVVLVPILDWYIVNFQRHRRVRRRRKAGAS